MKSKPLETSKLADDLQTLVKAAARFFDEAAREHRQECPQDAEAFALCALAGATPTVRIGLFPDPAVEVGYDIDGAWKVFFSWTAPQPRPDKSKFN
jgi:hypothetical protein